jgi:hypothetical protein
VTEFSGCRRGQKVRIFSWENPDFLGVEWLTDHLFFFLDRAHPAFFLTARIRKSLTGKGKKRV